MTQFPAFTDQHLLDPVAHAMELCHDDCQNLWCNAMCLSDLVGFLERSRRVTGFYAWRFFFVA